MESDTTPTQIVQRHGRKMRPAAFCQRDVKRAVKAVQGAGLQVGMVRVEPDGAIIVIIAIPGTPPAMPSSGDDEPNEWDE